ncbi:hypothetical protein NK718_20200 [Alsobacter sp. SYSU M60028]|uniref:DUF1134 domain-containing protein n=1 Tax=Alsobacter ponti TaxID=2962936 RepID=A0ABT1LH81_9HYPH|nr:hypothetical protein [Alsobacter ponti]MCP8940855.1 hypothetical protein [Alsobacter ponti]
MKRRVLLATFAAAALAVAAMPGLAEAKTAAVRIQIVKAGLIVGMSGGKGTITMDKKTYPLKIGGVSLGATIGASKADLVGTAYNLTSVQDIVGTYTAAEAGVAVAGGAQVARLKNSKGVVIELKGRQMGAMFSLDLNGLEIGLGR